MLLRGAALLLLLTVSAAAQPMQNDCRGPGSIGTALMGGDGTITLNIRQPQPGAPLAGVVAVKRGDPNYARVLSHVGGLSPGDKKPVPPWC
jgi:hypothetical protein